jgi:signal transduction histidine kinase
MRDMQRKFYQKFLQPKSAHPDQQRREFIFNILISLFTLAAVLTMISSALNHLVGNAPQGSNSLPVTALFLGVVIGLWALSRKGRYVIGAYVLVTMIMLAGLQLMLTWSFVLPMAQLVQVLVIVVAGVIISSRASVLLSLLVIGSTLLIGYLQASGQLTTNTTWMTGALEYSDAIGQAVVFSIIGGVSWLSNKEIDSLLRRAWRSEAALQKERDQLELTVAARTKELEQTQLKRTLELQQLAEFGRVSASLIHDLSSPIAAAALNLQSSGDRKQSAAMQAVTDSLRQVEKYITSTRKQLRGTSKPVVFRASQEIEEVINLLSNQATSANVGLTFVPSRQDKVLGDPVAFQRVVANLVLNAIQAYDMRHADTDRLVTISVQRHNKLLQIRVADHGIGIKSADIHRIFEPFYSTKKDVGRGLGIGLAGVRQIIEHDFNGSITVVSTPKTGTTFTLDIPRYEAKSSKKHQSGT